jgi:Protein of unknown function (DUF4238)
MHPKSSDSHFVPKVYLKKFTKRNGKLFQIKKNAKKQSKLWDKHPSEICYQKGFYEFSSKHPLQGYIVAEPNYLEERGFLYENRLNKWIDKVISPTQSMLLEEAYDLAATLFNLKIRNPYYREHSFSDMNISTSVDNILADERQRWEAGQSIAQLRGIPLELVNQIAEGLRQEWTTDKDIAKELHNRSLLENLHNPSQTRKRIYYKLAAAKWVIYKTTIGNQFVCSDNPGYCLDEENKLHNIKFGGPCTFIFPLTSYYALAIIANDDEIRALPNVKHIEHIDAIPEVAKLINYATWLTANKEVYAAHEQSLLQTQYAVNGSKLII